mgnify:CR=1 FL=1
MNWLCYLFDQYIYQDYVTESVFQGDEELITTQKRAKVENVDHPDGLLKCQVRLVGLWDGVPLDALPWAEYHLPVGARFNDGDFKPCQVGDYVWVRFDEGDSRYPIITGSCYFAPDVTIEDDLKRRDLTVNAMALNDNGEIIDPYHGQKDLENRVLRHVSDAFIEDPLRVLRVARFAARYHNYGFI